MLILAKIILRSQSLDKHKLDLKWFEDEKKQKYDKFLTSKIGFTSIPFIKQLEEKRNYKGIVKIGQLEDWSFLKRKRSISKKIGHDY